MRPRRRSEWKVEEGSHTESSDGETNEARPEAVSPIRLDLPARVETVNGTLGRIDSVEFDVYLALGLFSLAVSQKVCIHTCDSFSTLMARTLPYFDSTSPLTSSARSLSQSRSVSLWNKS